MRIEISERNFKALCELAKSLPPELAAKESASGKSIGVECRNGTFMHGDVAFGDVIVALVAAAKLMREISYDAQINRLQQERDGTVFDG